MLQSFRLPQLWVALAFVAVLTTAAPTESPEETLPIADPPEADLGPASPADDQPPSEPGLGGWSSFISGFSRRRSPSGERVQGASRNGRRQSQAQSGHRRRGQQIILVPQDYILDDFDDFNAIEKTKRRGSESKNRKKEEVIINTFTPPERELDADVSSGKQQKESGGGGGRFGRGNGGRRGGKKKEDIELGEVKPEGRRAGSKAEKSKAKSEPVQTESQEEPDRSNPDPNDAQRIPSFAAPSFAAPSFAAPSFAAPSFAAPGSYRDPCEDLLVTRAGSARETVAALLKNIDDPDQLKPILEDLDINLKGPQDGQP